MTKAIVYGLHNGDGVIRYIGCTTQPIEKRVSDHMGETRLWIKRGQKLSEKHKWICDILLSGGRVQGTVLFTGTQKQALAEERALTASTPNLTNSTIRGNGPGRPVGTKDSKETRRRKSEAWDATREERRVIMAVAQKSWRQRRPEDAARLAKEFTQRFKEWVAVPENNQQFRRNMSKSQQRRWSGMTPEERHEATVPLIQHSSRGGKVAQVRRREKLGYPFPELSMSHPKNLTYHLERKKQ